MLISYINYKNRRGITMKKVLIPLAPGFEEIETITVVDILRRSGARVIIAGLNAGVIKGSRGVKVLPDKLLNDVNVDQLDLIVLPGGQPGTENLKKDERIITLLNKMNKRNKIIGAICAAPLILEDNGLLDNIKRTCHPSVRQFLSGKHYSNERVVVDGNIITSQAPGTAMEFALRLVEILFGENRAKIVNKSILHQS